MSDSSLDATALYFRLQRGIFADFESWNDTDDYEYIYEEFTDEDDEDVKDFGAGKVADDYKADLQFEEINGRIKR